MLPVSLPKIFRLPVKPLCYLLTPVLNRLFEKALEEEELAFLEGHTLRISVSDIEIDFDITLLNNKLVVMPARNRWGLHISGRAGDFMQLASRREDSDTLFFQRRITTEGDTELGLYLKNFLDSQELSDLPYSGLIETGLHRALEIHDRMAPIRRMLRGA